MTPLFKDQFYWDTFKAERPAEDVLEVSFVILGQDRRIVYKYPEDRGSGLDLGSVKYPE